MALSMRALLSSLSITAAASAFSISPLHAQGQVTSASISAQGQFSGQTDTPGQLNCSFTLYASLGSNHLGTYNSNDFKLQIGVDANFGGIGTLLQITNLLNNQSDNLIENRSGAGAGWQTSYYAYDQPSDTMVDFNQAAGNSVEYQWGYATSIVDLSDTAWKPLNSDHVTTSWSNSSTASTAGTTPCNSSNYQSGYQFDHGRSSIKANALETSSGLVVHVTDSNDIKADINQYWTSEEAEQALYLSKAVAVKDNLRVYLVGKSGWTEGPISPIGSFVVNHQDYSKCVQTRCIIGIKQDLSYMLLIWNIGGKDFGIAVTNPGLGVQLNSSSTVYCENQDDASCGSIDVHTWIYNASGVSINKGSIRSLRNEYYIGDLAELANLGFSPNGVPLTTSYTPEIASNCNITTSPSSNNQLASHPASQIGTGSLNFYSSNLFANSTNNNQTYVSAATSGQSGHIQLQARMFENVPNGFPDLYQLSMLTTDATRWVPLGTFNNQPDINGLIDLPIGYKLSTPGFLLIPTSLGQDVYNNYYLQMSDISGCN